MKKVITYGTFDLFHFGHKRLLERAKALGDYLIVGITTNDFDLRRGKINVQQSLMERVEAVRASNLADEIIIEEYDGQKIDDIRRLHVDIFTVGSDWKGKFDYLKDYCEVVYLDRTSGVSSSELRTERSDIKIGIVGEIAYINKFYAESKFINGVNVTAICAEDLSQLSDEVKLLPNHPFETLLKECDALYIASHPSEHYRQIKRAIECGRHVICESPLALTAAECNELFETAEKHRCCLYDLIKTAHSMAYSRLLLAIKSGIIGKVVSVDSTCTSLFNEQEPPPDSIWFWGPTALLPVFQILGTDCKERRMATKMFEKHANSDSFTKIDFTYPYAVASIKVGTGVKSEGELIVSGTKGYVYVPAPWWKTDYFEIRYENPADNKRYFYQLDGEGIRNAILSFARSIANGNPDYTVDRTVSTSICSVLEDFTNRKNTVIL